VTFPVAHLVPLALCLLIGVIWDLRVRRIPNAICGAIAVAGLGAQFWNVGVVAAATGLGMGIATIAALYLFWQRGGIGGGDVKLAAAVAIWLAPRALPVFWLASAVAGGVTAAVCWAASRAPARREIRANLTLAALHQAMPQISTEVQVGANAGRISVPYGVAIAAGAVVVWLRG
jgi:prepilin peptidase CpaA